MLSRGGGESGLTNEEVNESSLEIFEKEEYRGV